MEVGKSRSACLSVSRMFGQPLNPVVSHCVQILAHKPSQESTSILLFERQDERLQTETFHRTASCSVSYVKGQAGRSAKLLTGSQNHSTLWPNEPASISDDSQCFLSRKSPKTWRPSWVDLDTIVRDRFLPKNFAPTWFTTSVSVTEVSIHHWSPSLLSLKLKLPPDLLFLFQTGNDAKRTSALVSPNIWIQERSPKSLLTNACV